jgi:hypothetical protein
MQKSERREYSLTSELQEGILRHVCKTKNADYKTISKETDKDRITILQSLEPLKKRHYIFVEKIHPALKKSKLIFKPTDKGVFYALAFLGVTLDDISRTLNSADEIGKYAEFVRNIRSGLQRRQLQQNIARRFIEHDLFYDTGKLMVSSKDDYIKQGLRLALLEAASNKNYDPMSMFNVKTVDSLRMIFAPNEMKELREFFTKIRDNLNSAIRLLPE